MDMHTCLHEELLQPHLDSPMGSIEDNKFRARDLFLVDSLCPERRPMPLNNTT